MVALTHETRELARLAAEARSLADRLTRLADAADPAPSRMDFMAKSRPTASTTSLRAKVHAYLVANPGWCSARTVMAGVDVRCDSALVCTALTRLARTHQVERRANINGGGDRWEWRAIT
jgi:hypothetical protein